MGTHYDGPQIVGVDLHRRRSVLVRMTPEGERLGKVRIINSPEALRAEIAKAGTHPKVVLEATYGYWAADVLKGPVRGVYYLLYVITDIFSRKVVHWEIWPTENGTLAGEFIQHAIAANDGIAPRSIHADRGTSMTSNTVTGLLALLGIDQSHSRPHVSNDNPYSEANFKTLKYCPAFPGRFGSIEDANVFCAQFFTYYNHEHRHSRIGMHIPASVHDGSAAAIQAQRAATLHAAFLAHPERFRGRRPCPPPLPTRVWINQPPTTPQTDASPQTTQVA
jgi:putative transposase